MWRVTKSTSLGLSSKIRGRVIVWLSEIFIQWNQGLCILVVSASELPVKNRNSFFVSPINCLGVLLSRLWEGWGATSPASFSREKGKGVSSLPDLIQVGFRKNLCLFHIIPELFGLEGTSGGPPVQCPASWLQQLKVASLYKLMSICLVLQVLD